MDPLTTRTVNVKVNQNTKGFTFDTSVTIESSDPELDIAEELDRPQQQLRNDAIGEIAVRESNLRQRALAE